MNLDWTINIGTLITVIVFIMGAISAYYTLKYQSRDANNKSVANGEQIKNLQNIFKTNIDDLKTSIDNQHKQISDRINMLEKEIKDMEITLAKDYVNKSQLRQSEGRIEKRLDKMEENLIGVFSQRINLSRRSKPSQSE